MTAITFVFFLFFGPIVNGYTISKLWEWFVVPTFHLPLLGIPQAIGLGMVVSILAKEFNSDHKKDQTFGQVLVEGFVRVIFINGMFLLEGAIVRSFM